MIFFIFFVTFHYLLQTYVPSAGIEPASQASEACVLSIELQGVRSARIHAAPLHSVSGAGTV